MKKSLSVLLSMAMAFSLVACGAAKEDVKTAETELKTEDVKTEDSDSKSEVEDLGDFEMIVGHAQPESNPRYISMEKFAKDVEEKTDGHVKVTVHGNGQLGTEKEMLEQVVTGTIQGMRGGQFDFSPRLLMFTLPFIAHDREDVTALLHSDLAKKVCKEAEEETGTVIINLCDAGGFRQFSNNKHEIKQPSDLKGLKMRTNGMKTIDLTFQELGATTTSIPYADLYMGLKTGVADGQENPYVNVEGMKFYEVQKYFTEVNYQFHPDPFYMNAEWWNSLPEAYQDVILECADSMGEYNDQLIDENSDKAKQIIIDSGAEVYVPTKEEIAAFEEAVQPVYDKSVQEGICTEEEVKELKDIVASAN